MANLNGGGGEGRRISPVFRVSGVGGRRGSPMRLERWPDDGRTDGRRRARVCGEAKAAPEPRGVRRRWTGRRRGQAILGSLARKKPRGQADSYKFSPKLGSPLKKENLLTGRFPSHRTRTRTRTKPNRSQVNTAATQHGASLPFPRTRSIPLPPRPFAGTPRKDLEAPFSTVRFPSDGPRAPASASRSFQSIHSWPATRFAAITTHPDLFLSSSLRRNRFQPETTLLAGSSS
uniref:Uncharacterized protein n=1 Tax=Leersia perrieri TaxID=77586 RepID=A0A0D9VZY3_9ORYZ